MAKKKSSPQQEDYALQSRASTRPVEAPLLPYLPPRPQQYRPQIGLIGCGGITGDHLKAYRHAGYQVVALTDLDRQRAEARRAEYYPDAAVLASAAELLARPDIDVVDIATHPDQRVPLIREAIAAGKHILSQKPFVLDLAVGRELVKRARAGRCGWR